MSLDRIRNPIQVIRQPRGSKVCWAAAVAMTVGGGQTIATVQAKAAEGNVRLNADGSLPTRDLPNVRSLANQYAGLRVFDARECSVTVADFSGWLRRGRFALLGGFNYRNVSSARDHAVTVYGIDIGATTRILRVYLAAPFNGLFHDDFENFEGQVMADPHFIIHW